MVKDVNTLLFFFFFTNILHTYEKQIHFPSCPHLQDVMATKCEDRTVGKTLENITDFDSEMSMIVLAFVLLNGMTSLYCPSFII